ncbi:MAG: site-specific DNA-methyltransferase, partial [Rhodospirillales bacterium]|nr:site-specific DNA-methyltransferase [Rhodospirillales bacterium]
MQQPIFDNKAPAPNEIGDPTKLSSMIELKIVHRPVAELRPNNHNARSHSKKQIKAIAASIRRLGFNNPVLIDRHGMIIAGHGRCEAAKLIGLAEVPTIRLDHLGPDEIRAYVLADNQLAALAGWDPQILAIELQHLVEVDFDVDITGFEAPEVDKLIEAQLTGPGDSRADDVPDISTDEPPTSRPGDVWLLGQHRLTCGDALNPAYYKALMGTKRARQLFSDPPYNVRIDGNVCGTGSIKHREFAMASGEMSRDEFAKFLKTALSNAAQFSIDGAVHYVCIDWRHVDLLLHTG